MQFNFEKLSFFLDYIALLRYKEEGFLPRTDVVFFSEEDGSCPLLASLDTLIPNFRVKCIVRIERLAELGHELRRPEADYLRDDIYELRINFRNINYRILYFFYDNKAVLSHGIIKESKIPPKEIAIAIKRKFSFANNPNLHTYNE